MSWSDDLEKRVKESGNNICMGMDPVLDKFPKSIQNDQVLSSKGLEPGRVFHFYTSLLAEMDKRSVYPACVKPNIAYFASLGIEMLTTLESLISIFREKGIHVILDGKRGDIGSSSAMYAKEMFDVFGADSCTIAPYMGSDSVGPFLEFGDKGAFCLLRTSNKGGADLQNKVDAETGKPFYLSVKEKILSWNEKKNIGAVVGATNIEEMSNLASSFKESGQEVPWLIPGVGSQGGSAKEVMETIRGAGLERDFYIINSSSAINFAYLKSEDPDADKNYAVHAIDALEELIKEASI